MPGLVVKRKPPYVPASVEAVAEEHGFAELGRRGSLALGASC